MTSEQAASLAALTAVAFAELCRESFNDNAFEGGAYYPPKRFDPIVTTNLVRAALKDNASAEQSAIADFDVWVEGTAAKIAELWDMQSPNASNRNKAKAGAA